MRSESLLSHHTPVIKSPSIRIAHDITGFDWSRLYRDTSSITSMSLFLAIPCPMMIFLGSKSQTKSIDAFSCSTITVNWNISWALRVAVFTTAFQMLHLGFKNITIWLSSIFRGIRSHWQTDSGISDQYKGTASRRKLCKWGKGKEWEKRKHWNERKPGADLHFGLQFGGHVSCRAPFFLQLQGSCQALLLLSFCQLTCHRHLATE